MVVFNSKSDIFSAHKIRNFLCWFVIGLVNNFHYCVVLSAADQIASEFHLKGLVALVSWANVFGGLFVRVLNAFVFHNTPYNRRFIYAGVQTIIGLVLVCISPYLGSNNGFRFFIALIGVVNVGNGSSYGESAALGYIERFPPNLLGGWSSGTGMSGVAASLIYLALKAAGFSNSGIFLLVVPVVFAYWGAYFFGLVLPYPTSEGSEGAKEGQAEEATETYEPRSNFRGQPWSLTDKKPPLKEKGSPTTPLGDSQKLEARDGGTEASEHAALLQQVSSAPPPADVQVCCCSGDTLRKIFAVILPSKTLHAFDVWRAEGGLERMIRLHNLVLFNNLNLMGVYVFEYAAQFMAPFSFPCSVSDPPPGAKPTSFFLENAFVVTQFCYQIGVLCSRSSLMCVRIRKVHLLTAVQFLNAVGWFIQSKTLFISSDDPDRELKLAFVLFGWMVFVGLFGGASYVNVFANILEVTRPEAVTENTATSASSLATIQGNGVPIYSSISKEDAALRAKKDRELSMNIGALYAVGGIIGGSLLDVIFSNSVLNRSC